MKPLPSRLFGRLPVGSAADGLGQLWRDWRAKRKPMVLHPYVDLNSRWRKVARYTAPPALIAICFVYGFFFALTAPYLILAFAAPVVVLALLSIWALPETNTAPVKTMELFFITGIFGLILWPNYLALALPGLPWITATRLTLFPAALLLLLCLSSSRNVRQQTLEAADGVPALFPLLLLFAANSLVSLPLSHAVGVSVNQLIVEQITRTAMLVMGLYLFRKPGRAERYLGFLLMVGPPIALLAYIEFQEQHVLWLEHVPSFLKVPDPSAQLALSSQIRSISGQYRSKATFATGLGLAEYMSLLTPFALHWAAGRYPILKRLIGLAMLPMIYVVVRMTDSRLGVLGYLVSTVGYMLLWGLVRFRRQINDLTAAIIVYAYPAAMIGVLAASMFVHKIHVLIFGGGATVASNADRAAQFRMAMPAFLRNPIGYGGGQSGSHMGYGAGDFIAIDSYWILLSLDYGALGVVLYAGLFAVIIYAAVKTLLMHPEVARGETNLLIPLISFIAAFLLIRGVYAEDGIHPLVFTLLGMTVCLISRARQNIAAAKPAAAAAAPAASTVGRKAGVGPPSDAVKKLPSFGSVLLIMLGCAVAYYVACAVWSLAHH